MASESRRCSYCAKRFKRLEHLQRHQRIHTREKPFSCSCGQSYGRKDLLVRHERLTSHGSEVTARDVTRTEETDMEAMMSSFPLDPPVLAADHNSETIDNNTRSMQDRRIQNQQTLGGRSEASTNVLGNAPSDPQETQMDLSHDSRSVNANIVPDCTDDQPLLYESGGMASQPISTLLNMGGTSFNDFDTYWDDFDMSSAFILPVFDDEYSMPCWPPKGEAHRQTEVSGPLPQVSPGQDASQEMGENIISLTSFGSRMPSPQISPAYSTPHHSSGSDLRPPSFGRISPQEYAALQSKVLDSQPILPDNFTLYSRRMLSRFYEGYVNGYNRNVPLVHLASLSIAETSLALLLAMAGVGAYYRFEPERGDDLLQAARAVSLEYLRQRQGLALQPKQWQSSSRPVSVPAPGVANESSQHGNTNHRLVDTDGAALQAIGPANDSDELLQTTNALFLVMSMWIWRPRALLNEAISLQSLVANLVRELGLIFTDGAPLTPTENLDSHRWKSWIRAESKKRTMLVVFAAFNLHCIAYNIPPLLLSSEIRCSMPSFDDEWRASSADEWSEVSRRHPTYQKMFQERLDLLYQNGHHSSSELTSSLGAYVLIAALVQRIFFLRQSTSSSNLKSDDIDDLGKALRGWQTAWETGPESSLNPQSPFGSVAFNSTALLRLAWIRLHCDLGPCRSLESRDSTLVAKSLKSSPPLERRPRLTRAVLQAAHALLIPMRMGLQYAARVHTPSWSMLHALCNLECAFLLSKWLESVALTISTYPLEPDEADLLRIVRSIMDETDFPGPSSMDLTVEAVSSNTDVRRLGVQVANVWADIFKTAHAFDLVTLIGDSLKTYAQLMKQSIEDAQR